MKYLFVLTLLLVGCGKEGESNEQSSIEFISTAASICECSGGQCYGEDPTCAEYQHRLTCEVPE